MHSMYAGPEHLCTPPKDVFQFRGPPMPWFKLASARRRD